MASARCLSCGAIIRLGTKPKLGQIFMCSSCLSEFELVWLDPIELDWPFEEDVDYDDYDYEPDFDANEAYEDIDSY